VTRLAANIVVIFFIVFLLRFAEACMTRCTLMQRTLHANQIVSQTLLNSLRFIKI